MVVAMDEAHSTPAVRRHRPLRRSLLIAMLAAAGWLCGAATNTVIHTVQQADRAPAALTRTAAHGAVAPAPRAPNEPPATPALPVVAPAAEHPPRVPVDPASQRTSASLDGTAVRAEQQAEDDARTGRQLPGHPDRSPKPIAPGGTLGYAAHDTTVGERGVIGVLTDAAPRPPPATDDTTHGRTADATVGVAGLPATAPD
jgi:hypothetical protein